MAEQLPPSGINPEWAIINACIDNGSDDNVLVAIMHLQIHDIVYQTPPNIETTELRLQKMPPKRLQAIQRKVEVLAEYFDRAYFHRFQHRQTKDQHRFQCLTFLDILVRHEYGAPQPVAVDSSIYDIGEVPDHLFGEARQRFEALSFHQNIIKSLQNQEKDLKATSIKEHKRLIDSLREEYDHVGARIGQGMHDPAHRFEVEPLAQNMIPLVNLDGTIREGKKRAPTVEDYLLWLQLVDLQMKAMGSNSPGSGNENIPRAPSVPMAPPGLARPAFPVRHVVPGARSTGRAGPTGSLYSRPARVRPYRATIRTGPGSPMRSTITTGAAIPVRSTNPTGRAVFTRPSLPTESTDPTGPVVPAAPVFLPSFRDSLPLLGSMSTALPFRPAVPTKSTAPSTKSSERSEEPETASMPAREDFGGPKTNGSVKDDQELPTGHKKKARRGKRPLTKAQKQRRAAALGLFDISEESGDSGHDDGISVGESAGGKPALPGKKKQPRAAGWVSPKK
ncbi:hypothetical protein BT63DRAFT_468668 [Microthyrium microscopicum]|uniref:Uncharacterized protein n=1 Tax=Microthyrium microscopicum TaxID=703497 RepID=A0A6A6UF15_9PEZI|nr:hypothetical protein BT63DRAFT_468668 [Microthyrium microscopicum]